MWMLWCFCTQLFCMLHASQLQQTLKRFKGLTFDFTPASLKLCAAGEPGCEHEQCIKRNGMRQPSITDGNTSLFLKSNCSLAVAYSFVSLEHLILIVSSILFWLFWFAVLCATEDTSHYSSWLPKNAGSVASIYTIGLLSKKVVETIVQGHTFLSGITLPILRATGNISMKD